MEDKENMELLLYLLEKQWNSWTCIDLSEPVDGVKQQSTDEIPLSFWQALHFLHYVQVG